MTASRSIIAATKPPRWVGWTVSGLLVLLWGAIRLVEFPVFVLPLSYALPLLVCVWTRNKRALWLMAFAFGIFATDKAFWILRMSVLPSFENWAMYFATLGNIMVAAVVVHLIISLRDRMETALTAVISAKDQITAQADELYLRADKLAWLNEQLQAQRDELAQFSYVTSHDLKEPLRTISGFMGLLKEHYTGRIDKKADEWIGYATDGATRMSRLIEDLLAYTRIGGRERESAPVDLRKAFADGVANLRASIEAAKATVTADEPLPTVMADEAQMVLLFQNLIGNAIKFRREGVPPEIHVAARREAGNWLISVKDNGIGIPADQQARLFVIFQRLHSREKYPGTGIGLAICKKIVKQYGGRIWIESPPGEGTTFSFTIPAAAQAANPLPAKTQTKSPASMTQCVGATLGKNKDGSNLQD